MQLKYKDKTKFYLVVASCTLIFLLIVSIPLKLAIAKYQQPLPQAILTLGGGREREEFTAKFAQSHSSLPIWVSTGSPADKAWKIFQDAGIVERQIYLDRRATDTVTNFTSLVTDFHHRNFQHIFLITSDFHMPRAKAIAFVVLGSKGIAYTPVSIPSTYQPESKHKIVRDTFRAFMWLLTGRTGSSLNVRYKLN